MRTKDPERRSGRRLSASLSYGARVNSLAARTILGFVQLLLILGVLLFAPAWTLDFWQAWVYLAVFFGCAGLITAYLWKTDRLLLERRVTAGPRAEASGYQRLIQILASVAFVGMFVVASLDHHFGWSTVPLPFVIAGDLLVILGFLIVFRVFKENSFASGTIEVTSGQRVVSSGPYAVVRHPMYSGALIMLFGTAPALGSWWALAPFAALKIIIVLRLLDEEAFLSQHLPGYAEYCKRVRFRLLPGVW
jgi:protein-S-isoprenylcysteine O-methyltransferase Ste14